MSRKWAVLVVAAGCIAGLGAAHSGAGDEADEDKSPLARLMVKIDAETKTIVETSASAGKFKKAGKGKALIPAAEKLVEYGKETRKFTEPAKEQKQPLAKWNAMTDEYIKASEAFLKVAAKGDLADIRKAVKGLNNSCTNCHGAFRPKTGDDF